MVEKRKGIGYVIEAIAAVMTLLIFAVGNSPTAPVQDWSTFQKEIAANDLGYSLKQTGHLEDFVKDRETGSFRTVVNEISAGQLQVAGTVQGLPRDDSSIGFHTLPSDHLTIQLQDASTCSGDLQDDIDANSGTTIKETVNTPPNYDTRLYFADTDPEVSTQTGYDTMYVDNGTPCQFSSAEGPFYLNEFFKWGNSSDPAEYDYFQLKGLTQNEVTVTNSTQVYRLKQTMSGRLNGIKASPSFDTFRISRDDIGSYDVIVFKQDDAIPQLQDEYENSDKIEEYAGDGSILLMMNLTQTDFQDNSFFSDTGLEWVDLGYEDTPSGVRIDNSEVGEKVQKYLKGQDSSANSVSLPTGGKVSSATGGTRIGEDSIAYSQSGSYDLTEWNVTDYSMAQVDPDSYPSAPSSACYGNTPTGNFTKGEFTFPGTGETVDVLNVKLGDTQSYCSKNVRALKFLQDPDPGDSVDMTEDPYLNGESLTIGKKEFIVRTYTTSGNNNYNNGEAAEFIFSAESDTETINYRESMEDFSGERLARLAYKKRYSSDDRKMVASVLYWLVGDRSPFGSLESSSTSSYILGGIDENTFMPYKINLRWD